MSDIDICRDWTHLILSNVNLVSMVVHPFILTERNKHVLESRGYSLVCRRCGKDIQVGEKLQRVGRYCTAKPHPKYYQHLCYESMFFSQKRVAHTTVNCSEKDLLSPQSPEILVVTPASLLLLKSGQSKDPSFSGTGACLDSSSRPASESSTS